MIRMLTVGWLLATAGTALAAGSSRDFQTGTQGLIEVDPNELFSGGACNEFTPSVTDGVLRMDFAGACSVTGNPDDDSGVMLDPTPFGDTTAVMLMKWSTNPFYVSAGSDMNLGFLLRLNADPQAFAGYVVAVDDGGGVFLQKLAGLSVTDICPSVTIPGFDPSKDWWLRAECEATGVDSLIVRARVWEDGTPEPAFWDSECVDASGVYPPNGVGILVNEDSGGNGQFVDVDNVSAGPIPESICYNQADDDGDGLADCDDPDCAAAPACQCRNPFADADGDGDVDLDDYGIGFQRCYTGPAGAEFDVAKCDCFDRDDANSDGFFDPATDGNGAIDADDFLAFQACVSGPKVAANPTCDD